MPKLIILVGLSGSGKSTYANNILKKNRNYKIVSSDNIRAELSHYQDQTCNNKVFRIFHKNIKEHLEQGVNVIADATNLTMKSRRQIIDIGARLNATIECHIILKDIERCIKHDIHRTYSVGINVIEKQIRKFQIPFAEEGFESIKIINDVKNPTIDNYGSEGISVALMNFAQHNKYHNMTIGKHMELSTNIAAEKNYPSRVIEALAYHDIGKLYTQTFDDDGNAHYYGHENYGAYILLEWSEYYCFLPLETIQLVNYHMMPNNWNTEKLHNKYRRIFGENRYNNLLLMHKADKYRK